MQIELIRHGETAGNRLRRYIGATDEPLSAEGARKARARGASPDAARVYVSDLLRARQTARLLFPNAAQIVVPELREMNFGRFENRSAEDMRNDAAYRAWVDGGCADACPSGESRAAFCARVCRGFARVLDKERAAEAHFVVHGGTIMALMAAFARPKMGYYDARVAPLGGYLCEASFEAGAIALRVLHGPR